MKPVKSFFASLKRFWSLICGLALLLVSFQNFDYVDLKKVKGLSTQHETVEVREIRAASEQLQKMKQGKIRLTASNQISYVLESDRKSEVNLSHEFNKQTGIKLKKFENSDQATLEFQMTW